MRLELLPINSFKIKYSNPVNFTGSIHAACLERMPSGDIFEMQPVVPEVKNNAVRKTLKNIISNYEDEKILKNVLLNDAGGKKINAAIVRCDDAPDIYAVCVNKNGATVPVCKMLMRDDGDCIFIDSIKRTGNYNKIKGAGTELLKFAAETSIQKGYNGRVKLFAIASFPFYFKNNFRVRKSFLSSERDAYYSYMARTQSDVPKALPAEWGDSDFILTEDMALALLNDERLYEKDLCETEYDKILDYTNETGKHSAKVDVDFCETTNSSFLQDGNKEYVIQLVQRDDEQIFPIGALKVKLLTDESGKKYLNAENLIVSDTVDTPYDSAFYDAAKKELFKIAEEKARKFGADYVKYNLLYKNADIFKLKA